MAKEIMLSTTNNPFNPFTEFNSWFNFDLKNKTDCCGMIGRIAQCSNALSDELNDVEIEAAIDSIVESMPTIYVKLYKENADEVIKQMQERVAS
jgi:hypothetical protein